MERIWAERPLGMRDVYPERAKQRRILENKLLDFFENHGCEMVSSGTFEFVETLLRGRPTNESEDWIQLFDATGRAIALRPDMTPSIARMAAPLIASGRTPIHWCYAEKVYHRSSDPASLSWASGKAAESTQVGVEWVGRHGIASDGDLLELCQNALQGLELLNCQMVISHAVFTPALLSGLGLPKSVVESLLKSLTQGDYVGFRNHLVGYDIGRDVLDTLHAINPFQPESFPSDLWALMDGTIHGRELTASWDELTNLASELTKRGLRDGVSFDLTLHRDLAYYTGVVFEVFAPAVGAPVALGGRYDGLLAQFGADAPAIGFTFEVERLLTALAEQVKSGESAMREDW